MKRSVHTADKAGVDLTPMLDVVFILLIFFVVTASFVKERTLQINIPENQPDNQNQERVSIIVNVDADDRLSVDGLSADIQAVRSLLAQKRIDNPDSGIVVKAHELSTVDTYTFIANQAKILNAGDVSLITYVD